MPSSFRQFVFFSLLFVAVTIVHSGQSISADGDLDEALLRDLVQQLASDSFATRERSERRLYQVGLDDPVRHRQIKALLEINPVPPADLELYLAKKRLLERMKQATDEIRLDRFLHDPTFDQGSVSGWHVFNRHAGTGLDSRLVFVRILKEYPTLAARLSRWDVPPRPLADPDAVEREEVPVWAMLLLGACERGAHAADEDTMRLTATLRHPGSGPSPLRDHERAVISRLIASYLETATIDSRDRLVIGLRYQCNNVVRSDCHRVLSDPTQSASRIVTALLAASAMEPVSEEASSSGVDDWLERYRDDSRVSHVWRTMTPPKTTVRTQVRDVALALRIHRSGIDPRSQGFEMLEADPILVFRPYSLGFESEQQRRRAHAAR